MFLYNVDEQVSALPSPDGTELEWHKFPPIC
jgi:hypothetical protein